MSFSDDDETEKEGELFPGTIPVAEEQMGLFGAGGLDEWWKRYWQDMPEFNQEDLSPWKQVMVNFASPGDLEMFGLVIGQKMTENTRSIWFPPAEIGQYANKRWIDTRPDDQPPWSWLEEEAESVAAWAGEHWCDTLPYDGTGVEKDLGEIAPIDDGSKA